MPVLENHPEIGGRFSMFSPVGMFTAELIGLNSTALLEGAEACFNDFVNQEELNDSKVANLALIDIMLSDLAYVHRYSMVYADSLEATNKFRAQLKGESLNKNGIVSTVHIAGIGTVNHHSDLELLFKDNNNLVLEQIYFVKPAYETVNPKINLEILKDLENESNHASLIKNHIKPLRTYLIEKGNPVLTTVLPEQNEYNLAYFLFQDMLVTIVQAGIQDAIGSFEKLDLSIRQWEVERYKKSLSK
jgi:glucose-6-phosphate isomerase